MMKKIFLVLTIMMATGSANAGILIEPYIGYEMSKLDAKAKLNSIDAGGDSTGTNMGARLGYTFPIFLWAGLDYSFTTGGSFSSNKSGGDGDFERSDLYAVVGFNFPILLRAWAGYGLGNTTTYTTKSAGSVKSSGGSHMKFGVGFTFLPLVSINVEHSTHSPDSENSKTGDDSISKVYSSYGETSTVLSVSLPLDL